jgi:hypothetical protein
LKENNEDHQDTDDDMYYCDDDMQCNNTSLEVDDSHERFHI